MSFSQAEQDEIEKAQVRAKELLELFKGWVVKRKATVNQLRVIAEELRYVRTNVTAGKWVGKDHHTTLRTPM